MKQLYGVDGNPDLETQRSLHVEFGGRWAPMTALQISGSAFFDRVTDLIEGNYTSPALINVPRAALTGLEAGLQTNPCSGLQAQLSYCYLQARNRSDDRPGDDLQYRPEHQLDWGLRTGLPFQARLHLSGSAVSERPFYNDFHGGRRDRLASYATVDLFVRKSFSFGLELFAGAENLFDASYSSVFSSPAPGRQVRGGFNFGW
jgi:outer membrane receptor protein involved in Fe transport